MSLFKRSQDRPSVVPDAVRQPATSDPADQSRDDARHRELARELETLSRRVLELETKLEGLTAGFSNLTIAVAEGIEHVDRAERRVRATVARARRELEENGMVSPGLEAEHEQLRELDGGGGEERGVQPMRESVAEDPSRPIQLGDAFPGTWTEGDLASLMRSD